MNNELNEKTNAVLSDDELETVAGGLVGNVVQEISTGAGARVKCVNCGAVYMRGFHDQCPVCRNRASSNSIGINEEKNLIHKSISTPQPQNIAPIKK